MKAPLRWTGLSWSSRAALAALLLLALALRLYLLDHQSLWADEGNSVAMAPRAPLDIIQRTARDIHPPLYYLLLHLWTRLVGQSVFAVRALSALLGVLAVALTFQVGRRVGETVPPVAALTAAALLTISPFAIHYSQETRMYMLVATLGAASWLAWLRWNQRAFNLHALGYAVLTLALLYSHYYAISLLVAHNLAWLVGWLCAPSAEKRPRFTRWVTVQIAIVFAFLPWLWYARDTILNWPSISTPVTLSLMVDELPRIFTLGLANDGLPVWLALLVAVLLLAGALTALRAPDGIAALLYFITPPALMLLLALDRPFWNPKFLLLSLPGYCLVLGLGITELSAWIQRAISAPRIMVWMLAGLLLVPFAVGAAPALWNEYHDPRYARDDYRGAARLIEAQAGVNDVILLDGAGQREIFQYYYQGSLPVVGLPATHPVDEEATRATLNTLVERHDQLWVLWWAEQESDPALFIPRWLEENAFAAESRWYGNMRLERFTTASPPLAPLPGGTITFRYPGSETGFHLEAVGMGPNPVTAGQVLALYADGDAIGGASTDALPAVHFFAQVLDDANHVIGQYDGDAGAPPVEGWGEGVALPLRMGVTIPVGTIPGIYRLIMGAYDPATGHRFLTESGDALPVGSVQVLPPPLPPSADSIVLPGGRFFSGESFADLDILAARANRVGSDHAPETPLRPGEPFTLLIYWRLRAADPAFKDLTLHLVDSSGAFLAEWTLLPADNRFPAGQGRVGDLLRDPHTYFLPADLSPGDYSLSLGDGARAITIAALRVNP